MGIQKDAGDILVLIYENKIAGKEMLQQAQIREVTSWTMDRVMFALEYLVRKGMVDGHITQSVGTTKTPFVYLRDVTPLGIDVIENKPKFKETFNFTFGIPGFLQVSQGKEER